MDSLCIDQAVDGDEKWVIEIQCMSQIDHQAPCVLVAWKSENADRFRYVQYFGRVELREQRMRYERVDHQYTTENSRAGSIYRSLAPENKILLIVAPIYLLRFVVRAQMQARVKPCIIFQSLQPLSQVLGRGALSFTNIILV